jgi:hypothetical protein
MPFLGVPILGDSDNEWWELAFAPAGAGDDTVVPSAATRIAAGGGETELAPTEDEKADEDEDANEEDKDAARGDSAAAAMCESCCGKARPRSIASRSTDCC